jgi:hypothetical protein
MNQEQIILERTLLIGRLLLLGGSILAAISGYIFVMVSLQTYQRALEQGA